MRSGVRCCRVRADDGGVSHRPSDISAGPWGRRFMGTTRTYRAGTMREALALVRRDLGGHAVILHTREVRRRRLFGLGTRELIEVTASDGLGPQVAVKMTGPATTAPPALQAQFGEQLGRLHAMVETLS